MTSTLQQKLFLILAGLSVIAVNTPQLGLSDQGAALLMALACAIALWLAGNWDPR